MVSQLSEISDSFLSVLTWFLHNLFRGKPYPEY